MSPLWLRWGTTVLAEPGALGPELQLTNFPDLFSLHHSWFSFSTVLGEVVISK